MEHRARDRAAARARRRRAARAPTARRRRRVPGAAAKRSPTSRCTIATQRVTLGQLLDRAQDRRRGDAVGQVRDDLRRRRVAARRGRASSRRPSARRVRRAGRARRAARGSSARSISTTCTCATRVGEVLGQHAEAAADLEHDVARRRARRRARSRRGCSSRSGSSGPSSRLGRTPNAPQPAQARLDGELASPAEQRGGVAPRRPRRAPRSATPRALGDERARCATTYAGWLRSLRTACGVRYGASVSTSRRSSGTRAAASRELVGLRVGDVAGEGDPPAALAGTRRAARASRSSA